MPSKARLDFPGLIGIWGIGGIQYTTPQALVKQAVCKQDDKVRTQMKEFMYIMIPDGGPKASKEP
jgi:hypothetical protein